MKIKKFKVKDKITNKFVYLYECNSCNNTWSLDEGFHIKTGQCKGCQEWDDTKEERNKIEERRIIANQFLHVNFPYMAGDPFW